MLHICDAKFIKGMFWATSAIIPLLILSAILCYDSCWFSMKDTRLWIWGLLIAANSNEGLDMLIIVEGATIGGGV